jgi:putative PIN family toxin of toxin-antitoxin system
MAQAKRKVKRFVIDVNSFISIFINKEHEWLLNYVIKNKIEIFTDKLLLRELIRVLEYKKIKNILPFDTIFYIRFVQNLGINIVSQTFNLLSPDPDDNYLYDIALSANAKLLVTGEKALLNWEDSPIETISLSDFKHLF